MKKLFRQTFGRYELNLNFLKFGDRGKTSVRKWKEEIKWLVTCFRLYGSETCLKTTNTNEK